jgi:hypothetical protein
MKSILYAGAALMIGASIYGFVDYKQSSRKKEFKKMYLDENVKTTDVITKTETKGDEKNVVEVNSYPENEKVITTDPSEITNKTGTPSNENKVYKKAKKKKKINTRFFSRAPLREEQEDELPPPPPKELKKTENKEH